MTIEVTGTTVEVLGKIYQLKCPENEIAPLQNAAKYLEEKMQEVRNVNHVLSIDRIAVIAALNMTHQLLALEHEKLLAEERLRGLENKLQKAIVAEPTRIVSAE